MATTMEAAMFIMFNMHACVRMHVYMRMCMGVPPPNPTPTTTQTPTPHQGRTPQVSKNAIRLEWIETRPPMGGCWFHGWVGGWVGRIMWNH